MPSLLLHDEKQIPISEFTIHMTSKMFANHELKPTSRLSRLSERNDNSVALVKRGHDLTVVRPIASHIKHIASASSLLQHNSTGRLTCLRLLDLPFL